MRSSNIVPAAVTAGVVLLLPPGSRIADSVPWLCSYLPGESLLRPAAFTPPAAASTPTPPCAPAPTGYHSIQQAAGDGRWCTRPVQGEMIPIPSCYAMTDWRRTESGRPASNIRFSTATPMAASVCCPAKPRARSRGPSSVL
jgi:hypothetical protein